MQLTESNYHSPEANREYMSASQLKAFISCPAQAVAELNGEYQREDTTALLVGSYVDAHFSGTLDLFRAEHPEIYTKAGALRAEYQQADAICESIQADPLLMAMMGGESQRIVTGEIAGVPFKAKPDFLLSAAQCEAIVAEWPGMADTLLMAPGAIVDLKVVKDLDPIWARGRGKLSVSEAWRWDLQLGIYQKLIGGRLPCFIVAATKQKQADKALIRMPDYLMDAAVESAATMIPAFNEMKLHPESAPRCEHCDYCASSKVIRCAIDADELDGATA